MESDSATSSTQSPDIQLTATRRQKLRMVVDRLTTVTITGGGSAMILAVTLIFLFFLYTVFPLFIPAAGEPVAKYPLPGAGEGETLPLPGVAVGNYPRRRQSP